MSASVAAAAAPEVPSPTFADTQLVCSARAASRALHASPSREELYVGLCVGGLEALAVVEVRAALGLAADRVVSLRSDLAALEEQQEQQQQEEETHATTDSAAAAAAVVAAAAAAATAASDSAPSDALAGSADGAATTAAVAAAAAAAAEAAEAPPPPKKRRGKKSRGGEERKARFAAAAAAAGESEEERAAKRRRLEAEGRARAAARTAAKCSDEQEAFAALPQPPCKASPGQAGVGKVVFAVPRRRCGSGAGAGGEAGGGEEGGGIGEESAEGWQCRVRSKVLGLRSMQAVFALVAVADDVGVGAGELEAGGAVQRAAGRGWWDEAFALWRRYNGGFDADPPEKSEEPGPAGGGGGGGGGGDSGGGGGGAGAAAETPGFLRRPSAMATTPPQPPPRSFRASCVRDGRHAFQSVAVAEAVGSYVIGRYGWRVDLEGFELEVFSVLLQGQLLLGLPLERRQDGSYSKLPSSQRDNLDATETRGATLRPSTAWALLQLAAPRPADVLLDSMAGVGTLPIEAAANGAVDVDVGSGGGGSGGSGGGGGDGGSRSGTSRRIVGLGGEIMEHLGEQLAKNAAMYARNAVAARRGAVAAATAASASAAAVAAVHDAAAVDADAAAIAAAVAAHAAAAARSAAAQRRLSSMGPAEFMRSDAARLPLRSGCVDVAVVDLPFGVRCGSSSLNKRLYPYALSELARVVRPAAAGADSGGGGGRVVLMTSQKKLLYQTVAMSSRYWVAEAAHEANIGGLTVVILLLRRSATPPPADGAARGGGFVMPEGQTLKDGAVWATSRTSSSSSKQAKREHRKKQGREQQQ